MKPSFEDPAERGHLRLYYRNWRPTWFGRLSNRLWAWMCGLAPTSDTLITLQVKDRRTGRLRSTILATTTHEGARYVVSMLGNDSEWVGGLMQSSQQRGRMTRMVSPS